MGEHFLWNWYIVGIFVKLKKNAKFQVKYIKIPEVIQEKKWENVTPIYPLFQTENDWYLEVINYQG